MAVNTLLSVWNLSALDRALKAADPSEIDGLVADSTPGVPIRMVFMGETAIISPANEAAVQAVFDAHDPVFLTANKTAISADGVDFATVTVNAPKPGVTSVTLSVSIDGGPSLDWIVPITGGAGSDVLTSALAASITVKVKNAANRSTDQLTIEAR